MTEGRRIKALSFDLATLTGVAWGVTGGKPEACTVDLRSKKDDDGARYAKALRMAEHFVQKHQPDLVCIEAPVGGREASAFLIGLIACVEGQCVRMGIRVVKYYPASIRRHFLGRALTAKDFPAKTRAHAKAAIKQAVVDRCRLLGWEPKDGNCGDAMAAWDYALALESRAHQVSSLPGLFQGVKV
jgi:Holliday junction resolvasome RuvABC endonuclease subunit